MTLETEVEAAFVKYAKDQYGLEALKLRIDGQNGWLDRTVFTAVGVIVFEFKKLKTGKARKMQVRWAKYLTDLGYEVHWPRRIGEAEKLLDGFISRKIS